MEIKRFPFSAEFKEAMLKGIKTKTSRRKRYGDVGDTFKAFDDIFTIIKVNQEVLEDVANKFYEDEGFETPEAFIEKWKQLHPRVGWKPEQKVFVHEFKKGDLGLGQRSLEV